MEQTMLQAMERTKMARTASASGRKTRRWRLMWPAAVLLPCMLYLAGCASAPVAGTQPLADVAAGPGNPVAQALEALRTREGFGPNDAVVVLQGERVLYRWGEVDAPMYVASVRKSIISLLFGVAAEKGLVRLDATLAELGIDEARAPLTDVEKRATVRDLLKARSGIYIESSGETPTMKAMRPQRGQYAPGEHFYYNNWDFNVLGVILEQRTGMGIGQLVEQWLAQPLGMTHFRAADVTYTSVASSEHRQYMIDMSAEDLARIGAMVLQRGSFAGRQVVPEAWIDESLQPHSTLPERNQAVPGIDAYGYLWWIDSDGADAWASGFYGQFMIVDRDAGIVVVTRNDYGRGIGWVWERLFGESGTYGTILAIQRTALKALTQP
jgi:CubicO group peptidase (beta-lactamase class C family)